jgi:hypothetical protein
MIFISELHVLNFALRRVVFLDSTGFMINVIIIEASTVYIQGHK